MLKSLAFFLAAVEMANAYNYVGYCPLSTANSGAAYTPEYISCNWNNANIGNYVTSSAIVGLTIMIWFFLGTGYYLYLNHTIQTPPFFITESISWGKTEDVE